MPMRNPVSKAAEECLRTLERLVSQGDLDFAKFAIGLYGPDFDASMDDRQAERMRAIRAGLRDLENAGPAEEPAPGGPGMR